ncbi:SIMPL domain-containing protein [Flavicella marina]|uniref:SIMPL domain-containing protein n=1 Tax=Flavicella marina TaxID=1475951 RepID=UPI00126533AA|nr:SIMPL domain-containing protein [Flavicella marina]
MKKLGIIVIAFVSVFSAVAQTKNFIDQPYVDTTAKVDTLVVPDRIFVTIVLQEEDSKGKVSIEDLEKKLEKVLTAFAINTKKDLQVTDMSSNYKQYFLKKKDIHKNKSFSLLLRDAKTANTVFVALEKEGISNVFLEKTEYSNSDQLQLFLKMKAIKKAKLQAEYLTNALGQEVGKALYIMDRNNQLNRYHNNQLDEVVVIGYGTKMKEDYKPIEVEFEKILLETTVSVKFELK